MKSSDNEKDDTIPNKTSTDSLGPIQTGIVADESATMIANENEIVIEPKSLAQHELKWSPIRVREIDQVTKDKLEEVNESNVSENERKFDTQSTSSERTLVEINLKHQTNQEETSTQQSTTTSKSESLNLAAKCNELDKFFIHYKGK